MEKDRKLLKNDKHDNVSRMQFLQPAILFVIFLSFGGKFIIFLSLWCHFLKHMENMENCSKNDEKMTKKMAMLREKCTFCNLQNCHFVCHFLSFGGFFFWSFWCNFFKTMENIENCLKNDKK